VITACGRRVDHQAVLILSWPCRDEAPPWHDAVVADPTSLLRAHGNAVLATIKKDGRPQLSNVSYAWDGEVVRASITDGRAKTHNMRRDPRVALEVTTPDMWQYVVIEADAELGAVAADEHDDAVEDLVALYRDVSGEHPDWDDYRRAMVADRRLVLRLRPTRTYGIARD
jgi:PPOX class probable F420-dependent enzyme